VFNISVWRG